MTHKHCDLIVLSTCTGFTQQGPKITIYVVSKRGLPAIPYTNLKKKVSWTWWLKPVIQHPGWLSQEEHGFKPSLGNLVKTFP